MLPKTLLILAVLSAFGGASGCLTGGRTGGTPATNPLLAPITGGVGREEGGGLPASGMGGGGGSTGTTVDGSDGGDGGGGLGGGPDGITSDTGGYVPIIAVGTPMGQTPGPHCLTIGSRLVFDDAVLAITGKTDELGRSEILLKSHIRVHDPNGTAEDYTSRSVAFINPDSPSEIYGHTAPWNGCVFARIYAPRAAAGKVIRLSVSDLVCAPEGPEVGVDGVDSFTMRRGGVPRGFSTEPGSTTAALDVTLPEKTPDSALEDCGYFDWREPFWDQYLTEQVLQRQIEKAQEDDSGSTTSPSWKDSLKDSMMQRAR